MGFVAEDAFDDGGEVKLVPIPSLPIIYLLKMLNQQVSWKD